MTSPRKILSILSGFPIHFMTEWDKQRIVSYCNHNDMEFLHNINHVMGGGLIPTKVSEITDMRMMFIKLATNIEDKDLLVDVLTFAKQMRYSFSD